MKKHSIPVQEPVSAPAAASLQSGSGLHHFIDNRPAAIAQRQRQEAIQTSPRLVAQRARVTAQENAIRDRSGQALNRSPARLPTEGEPLTEPTDDKAGVVQLKPVPGNLLSRLKRRTDKEWMIVDRDGYPHITIFINERSVNRVEALRLEKKLKLVEGTPYYQMETLPNDLEFDQFHVTLAEDLHYFYNAETGEPVGQHRSITWDDPGWQEANRLAATFLGISPFLLNHVINRLSDGRQKLPVSQEEENERQQKQAIEAQARIERIANQRPLVPRALLLRKGPAVAKAAPKVVDAAPKAEEPKRNKPEGLYDNLPEVREALSKKAKPEGKKPEDELLFLADEHPATQKFQKDPFDEGGSGTGRAYSQPVIK